MKKTDRAEHHNLNGTIGPSLAELALEQILNKCAKRSVTNFVLGRINKINALLSNVVNGPGTSGQKKYICELILKDQINKFKCSVRKSGRYSAEVESFTLNVMRIKFYRNIESIK